MQPRATERPFFCLCLAMLLCSLAHSRSIAQTNRLDAGSTGQSSARHPEGTSVGSAVPNNILRQPSSVRITENASRPLERIPVTPSPAADRPSKNFVDPWIRGSSEQPRNSSFQESSVQQATWVHSVHEESAAIESRTPSNNIPQLRSEIPGNDSTKDRPPTQVESKSTSGLLLRPPSDNSQGSLSPPKSGWNPLVSMFASLFVVIGLFLGATWMLRRTTGPSMSSLPKEVVQVLGRCAMAPRQQIYLLRFGNRLVLVSHQMGQTETLSEIEDPLEIDRICGLCEQQSEGSVSQSFRQVFQQVTLGSKPLTARVRA